MEVLLEKPSGDVRFSINAKTSKLSSIFIQCFMRYFANRQSITGKKHYCLFLRHCAALLRLCGQEEASDYTGGWGRDTLWMEGGGWCV